METYNVEWDSQSENVGDSMPLGGGKLGLNVWVEGDELLFYIGSNDAIDENLSILKLGRVRVKLDPNPFTDATSFTQKLDITKSNIRITGENAENGARIDMWVDVYNNAIHVDVKTEQPTTVSAVYENWRTADDLFVVPSYEMVYNDGQHYTYKDTFVPMENGDGLIFYHRNRDDAQVFDLMVEQQKLTEVKDQLYNPQLHTTFGGMIQGTGMKLQEETVTGKYADTEFTGWVLETEQPQTETAITVYTHIANTDTVEQWQEELEASKEAANAEDARVKTEAWWADFWDNSYIALNTSTANPEDPIWQMGRNIALTRYMQGCTALADYPIKFNGGAFVFDQLYVGTGPFFPNQMHDGPDYRYWGGGAATAQNQRILYWPMLKNGDFDMMLPQFDFYNNALGNAKLRVKTYWGHDGAMYEEWNTPSSLSPYSHFGGDSRPLYIEDGVSSADTKYQYNNGLEFAYMMVEWARYSGEDLTPYIDYIQSCVIFYYEHYQYRHMQETGEPFDAQGKLVISPSTAMETYKNATNPVDVICALHTLVDDLLEMDDKYGVDKEYFEEIKQHLPDVKYETSADGKKIITIADEHGPNVNFEMPELATVWPYGMYHIGSEDLEIAINTWDANPDPIGEPMGRRGNTDWESSGLFTARMGLVDVTETFAIGKMADNDDGYRFPVFYGQIFDWTPNVESAASGMNMVQEMLIQDYDNDVYLLPTTPEDWEVNSKLRVGLGTQVTVRRPADGKVEYLKISQLTDQRETMVLHYPGIDAASVRVLDKDGREVAVTRSEDTLTFAVEQGQDYYVTGIPASNLQAPAEVQALRQAVNGSEVSLTWSAADKAVSYNVYRLSTKDNVKERITGVTDTSYVDTAAEYDENHTYLYAVSSVNADGYESALSDFIPLKALAMDQLVDYDFETDSNAGQILDESGFNNSGKILSDTSGQTGNTGLIAGKDGEGQAYQFNNTFLEISSGFQLDVSKNFVVQADVYPTATDGNYRRIFNQYDGLGNSFLLDYNAAVGSLRLFTNGGTNNYTKVVTIPQNQWSTIRLEYTAPSAEAANGSVKVYLNDEMVMHVENLSYPLGNSTVGMRIGGDSDGNPISTWQGAMDNIRIENGGTVLVSMSFDQESAEPGVVHDSTAHGNNGAPSVTGDNAGIQTGNDGRVFAFNGQSRLDIPSLQMKTTDWTSSDGKALLDDFAVQVQVNPSQYGNYLRVFDFYDGHGFLLDANANGSLRLFTEGKSYEEFISAVLPLNAWSTVRLEYTAPKAEEGKAYAKIYLNDQVIMNMALDTPIAMPNAVMRFGADQGGTSQFIGSMDNIGIRIALDASQIEELPGSLKLQYTFDGGDAAGVILDSSVNGNNGTVITDAAGASDASGIAEGKDGQGYHFAGQTLIEVDGGLQFDPSQDFSVQADVYPTEINWWRRIFDMLDGAGNGFILDYNDKGGIRFLTHAGANWFDTADNSVPVNQWSTVRLDYTAAGNGHITISINGEIALDTDLNQPITATSVPLRIGGDQAGDNNSTFRGTMDNIAVYGVGEYGAQPKPDSIRLEADSTSIGIGESAGLKVVGVMPGGTAVDLTGLPVSYTSSNPDIADIRRTGEAARVKAYQAGSVTVSAALSWNGAILTTEETITVNIPENLERIFFDQGNRNQPASAETACVKVYGVDINGEYYDLTNAASIVSSDETVATVLSGGYIRALSSGDVTLTATIRSGEKTLTAESLVGIEKNAYFDLDFENIQEDTVSDASGNGRDGKLHGNVSIAEGEDGQGVLYEGGYVEVLNTGDADTGKSFTLEGSFKPTAYGNYLRLFDKKSTDTEDRTGLMLDVEPTGYLRLMHSNWFTTLNYRIPLNVWTNIRLIYDSVNQQALVFANDELVAKIANVSMSNVDTNLYIGADHLEGSLHQGYVDNVSMSAVTVTLKDFAVSGIDLSAGGAITENGGTLQVEAEVYPASARNKKLNWTITDENGNPTLLASVSEDGMVTAHANGKVKITATSTDGTNVSDSLIVEITGQKEEIRSEIADFGDGNWEVKGGGRWTVSDDGSSVRQRLQQGMDAVWSPSFQKTDCTYKNYTIEGTFKINVTDSEAPGYVGFKMRGDLSDDVMEAPGFYIAVEPRGRTFIYKNHRGETTQEQIFIPGFDLNQEFQLSVTVIDNCISVWVNGVLVNQSWNDELTAGEGYLSLYAGILPVEVKDVQITYLTEPGTEPSEPTTGETTEATEPGDTTNPGTETTAAGSTPPSTGVELSLIPLSLLGVAAAGVMVVAAKRKKHK